MHCPNCGEQQTYVLDSRQAKKVEGAFRRTRICYECESRFYTYEILREKAESAFAVQAAVKTFLNQATKEEA